MNCEKFERPGGFVLPVVLVICDVCWVFTTPFFLRFAAVPKKKRTRVA
jgi:hypothetical protein